MESFESRMKTLLDNLIEAYDQSTQLSLELNQSLLPPIDPEYCSTYSNLIYTPIKPQDPERLKRKGTFSTEQMQASRKVFRTALPNPDSSPKVSTEPSSSAVSSSSTQLPPTRPRAMQPPMNNSSKSSRK